MAAGLDAMLRACFPDALACVDGVPPAAARAKGAYMLLLTLDRPVEIARGRVAGRLAPGAYVYAGSARGAGGIAARLGRHFRRDKPIHWHVDELTAMAGLTALALPDGSECAIVARLIDSVGFGSALPGFGSSDCRRCPAHLLMPLGTHPVRRG